MLRKITLREQITISVTAGVLGVAIISLLVSASYGWRQIRSAFVQQGGSVAKSLAAQSSLALIFDSDDNAMPAVQVTMAFPGVRRVELRSLTNKLVLGVGDLEPNEQEATENPAAGEFEARLESETNWSWRFVAPVVAVTRGTPFESAEERRQVFGYVRVYFDKTILERQLRDLFMAHMGALIVFALLYAPLMRRLTGRITQPLGLLAAAMTRDNLSDAWQPMIVSGSKDVREMTTAFNKMIGILRHREREREALLAYVRKLAAHMEAVREEQNAVIARELHDSIGGSLTMFKLGIASLLEDIEFDSHLRERLEHLLDISKDAIRQSRQLTSTLRPTVLDDMGLDAAIRWYAGELLDMAEISYDLSLGVDLKLRSDSAMTLFRMVQEALTNVVKHASASRVVVETGIVEGNVIIKVADDGVGLTPSDLNKDGSFGLRSMHERAENLSGSVEVVSSGAGTTVAISVPLLYVVQWEEEA